MATNAELYRERIIQDPQIMVGNPVIKGTRIPVELVLGHLAHNPALDELFAAYPHLTIEDVQGCFAYAQSLVAAKRPRRDRRPRDATLPAAG